MRHLGRVVLFLSALGSTLSGQSLQPATASTENGPLAPAAAPAASKRSDDSTRRTRVISPEAAAALAAMAPKFAPPPKVPEKKPEEELPDLRETDKPKNTIIRLPKFVVREPRPPVFRERDVNNRAGFVELARRRYLSELDRGVLNRWSFLGVQSSATPEGATTARALDMYAEDERLRNMADMADLANMVQKSDAASGLYIKRDIQQTFLRTSDFGWQGGSPTRNAP